MAINLATIFSLTQYLVTKYIDYFTLNTTNLYNVKHDLNTQLNTVYKYFTGGWVGGWGMSGDGRGQNKN